MALDGTGRFHVLDPGNLRVSVFTLGDDGVHHVTDQRAPPGSVRICAAGERRFVLTTSATHLFIEIDENGEPVGSIGAPPEPDRDLAAEFRGAPYGYLLSPGPVACDEPSERLLYASLWTGHVRLYDMDGRLQWQMDLPGFRRVMMEYSAGAGTCCLMGIDPEVGRYDQIIAALLSDDEVLLSIRVISDGPPTHQSCRLNARTGEVLACSPSPDVMAGLVGPGREIRYTNHPYPYITIVSRVR